MGKRFHRGLPFCGIMFGLRQFGDVACGVAQGDQLLARAGNSMASKNGWFQDRTHPGQLSAIQPRLWLCGAHAAQLLAVKTINRPDFADPR
jgi:hypothetical protein